MVLPRVSAGVGVQGSGSWQTQWPHAVRRSQNEVRRCSTRLANEVYTCAELSVAAVEGTASAQRAVADLLQRSSAFVLRPDLDRERPRSQLWTAEFVSRVAALDC